MRCRQWIQGPWVQTQWGPMHHACAGAPAKKGVGIGTILVLAACGLVGLVLLVNAIPSKPSRPTASSSAPAEIVPPHRMLREFTNSAGYQSWAVLLGRPVSDHEMVALARMLRRVYPDTHFTLVDDASGVEAYARWAESKHANSPQLSPWPKAWVGAHLLALCQRWLDGRWACERYRPSATPPDPVGMLGLD